MHLRKLELEDQTWVPLAVKEGMTDYLRFLFHTFDLYSPVVPLLKEVIDHSKVVRVIDLCSGSGGPIPRIQLNLKKQYAVHIPFILTDLFPRIKAYQYLSRISGKAVSFETFPVDATRVSEELKGVRTMFSGIHHFDPASVEKVIANAVNARQPLAFFDGGNKSVFMILLILVFHPVAILLLSPFIKPFRWSRIFYTYFFPLIIVGAVWDGIISIVNLYRPSTLLEIARNIDNKSYWWKAGKLRNTIGLNISYLTGIPHNLKV